MKKILSNSITIYFASKRKESRHISSQYCNCDFKGWCGCKMVYNSLGHESKHVRNQHPSLLNILYRILVSNIPDMKKKNYASPRLKSCSVCERDCNNSSGTSTNIHIFPALTQQDHTITLPNSHARYEIRCSKREQKHKWYCQTGH